MVDESRITVGYTSSKIVKLPLWFLRWLYESSDDVIFNERISELTRHILEDNVELYVNEIRKTVYGGKTK